MASRTGSEAYGVVAEAAVAAGRSRPRAGRCPRRTGAGSPLAAAAGNRVPHRLHRHPQDTGVEIKLSLTRFNDYINSIAVPRCINFLIPKKFD